MIRLFFKSKVLKEMLFETCRVNSKCLGLALLGISIFRNFSSNLNACRTRIGVNFPNPSISNKPSRCMLATSADIRLDGNDVYTVPVLVHGYMLHMYLWHWFDPHGLIVAISWYCTKYANRTLAATVSLWASSGCGTAADTQRRTMHSWNFGFHILKLRTWSCLFCPPVSAYTRMSASIKYIQLHQGFPSST